MSGPGVSPLFVDTGTFYASFDEAAPSHERAASVFEAIGEDELHYRAIYTSTYVLDELATLVLSHRNHEAAVAALQRDRQSAAVVVHPEERDFASACEQFAHYDDHDMSFTDHMSAVLADDRDVDHVFTFDADHFRTLGFTVVPDDTGDP